MTKQNILRDCDMLRQNKTLENIYRLTCQHGDSNAAMWLENEEIKTLSFNAYAQMTDDYSAFFDKLLTGYDCCAISLDTCKEWFPIFWGLIRAGKNVILLDPSHNDQMTQYLMNEAGCKAILCAKERKLNSSIKIIPSKEIFTAKPVQGYKVKKWGEWVAMCTSGSTGTSRIFVYNGEALANQCLGSEIIFKENHRLIGNVERRTLAFLPYHHVLGFVANLLWCTFLGYTAVYLKDRTPQTILHTTQVCGVGQIISVPLLANNVSCSLQKKVAQMPASKQKLFHSMLKMSENLQRVAPERGLKFAQNVLFSSIQKQLFGTHVDSIVLGGGHTPTETLKLLNALGYFTICGFGMTETAVTSFESSLNWNQRTSGSVGKPLTNLQYRIVPQENDPDTGELFIRGESIHTGRLVGGKLLPPALEDGWLATGDLVHQDANGHITIVGRTKEIIINESGENIYPDELEDIFSDLVNVRQYCILGTAKKTGSALYQDITLVACVNQLDEETLTSITSQVKEINNRLPVMKRLTRVIATTDALPLVNSIKVKRMELRELIQKEKLHMVDITLKGKIQTETISEAKTIMSTIPASADFETLKQKIHNLVAEALEVSPEALLDDASLMEEMGGDSLQIMSVSLRAEEEFGVLIESEDYARCSTVNGLSEVIWEKMNGSEKQQEVCQERKPITRFEDTPEYIHFTERRSALMSDGDDDPYFACHESPLLDKSLMDGQEVLNFGSYNYVGMSGRKEVNDAAKAAIDKYGTSASGSRLLAGEKAIHEELEKEIANWKHTESAIVCVGGHSTNVTFIGNFCSENDLILYDALAHNSIEQGCRLSRSASKAFPHNDPDALETILKSQRKHFEKVLIVIEGAYSMDGDIANVPAFIALKKKYGCFLMVDEAHSACVIGEHGGGVDDYFHLNGDDIDIKMGTLSKGLGTCGGYLAGKKCLIDYLRYNMPGFVFSVGISPALAGATLEALRQLRSNPSIMQDMHRNIRCFVSECKKHRYDICLAGETAIIPVLVGSDEDAFRLSNEMRRRGVFVPPAVYPAVPRGKARLRFDVISEHKPEQIQKALNVLEDAAKDLGIELPRRNYEK